MARRPHPRRAEVDPTAPRAWATDDRSGFVTNHHKLGWQHQWAGPQLINTRLLVGQDMMDIPQEQLRTIILPPDPPPIMEARPEPYTIDETDWRVTQLNEIRETQDGKLRVTQPSAFEAEEENTG